jgi:hypothetical protein
MFRNGAPPSCAIRMSGILRGFRETVRFERQASRAGSNSR